MVTTIVQPGAGNFQKAVAAAKPGDNIHLAAGTFDGANMFGLAGGTTANPIFITADPRAVVNHVSAGGTNADEALINIESTGTWNVTGLNNQSDGSAQRACIRLANAGALCVIKGNTCNKGFVGIFVSGTGYFTLDSNVTSNSTDQHGIYISANTSNGLIIKNESFGNNYDGIHCNATNGNPNTANVFDSNNSHDNTLSGFDIEGVSGCTFKNNLSQHNQKHGFTIHSQDQANTPFTINNTFTGNIVSDNGMFAVQIRAGDDAQAMTGNWLIGGTGIYGSIGTEGVPTKLKSNDNVVVDNFSINLGVSKITLAQWQAQTGRDKQSVIGTLTTAIPGTAPAPTPTPSPTPTPTPTVAQLQAQINTLAAQLKQAQTGDLNLDGKVDFSDLLILMQDYSKGAT